MYGDYLPILSPSLLGLIAPKSPAQVAACSEALHGIRLLKTFAWEAAALRRIGRLRRAEWEPARDFVAASAFVMVVTVMIPYSGVAVALIGSYSAGVRARLRSSQHAVSYMPRLNLRLHRQQQRSVLVSLPVCAAGDPLRHLIAIPACAQWIIPGNVLRYECRRRTRLACSGS